MNNMKYLASLFIAFFLFSFVVFTQPATVDYRLVKITDELNEPWGTTFLPNGDLLVTELSGSLKRVSNGKVSDPIHNVPEVLYEGKAV